MNADEEERVHEVLRGYLRTHDQVEFHAIQTRESGQERFVSMHVLVPGSWTIQAGHDLADEIEAQVRAVLPGAQVHTHLEPKEDPRSYEDWTSGRGLAREPSET